MKYKLPAIILISELLLVNICAHSLASDFGPFRGKIVDADTKEPIEGVVVLAEWSQPHAQILKGGTTLIDAQETLTDKNGEFYIHGIWIFNPWRRVTADVSLYIYKSGYDFLRIGVLKKWNELNPTLPYVTEVKDDKPLIMLRKLTLEERKRSSPLSPSYLIPGDKKKLFMQEINKERKLFGLSEVD